MSLFQVQYFARNRLNNTILEASSYENLLSLFDNLCSSKIFTIKKILFSRKSNRDILPTNRSATIKIFKNNKSFSLRLPNLKQSVNEQDIKDVLTSVYSGIDKINVEIHTTKYKIDN